MKVINLINCNKNLQKKDIFYFFAVSAVSMYISRLFNHILHLFLFWLGFFCQKETLQGDLVFIESVPAGDIIPVMVQKVLVGAAASGGSPNTLTTAGELIAYF